MSADKNKGHSTASSMDCNEDKLFGAQSGYDDQMIDVIQKSLTDEIKRWYKQNNQWDISNINVHNIILIGRSRAGKSTVRKTLIDPTSQAVQLNLYAETKNVDVASLQVNRTSDPQAFAAQSYQNTNSGIILNIIDTPGLFEIKKDVDLARDNVQLLTTISNGLTRIGTSCHYICFCISVIDGIRREDLETLNTVLNYFGLEKFSEHLCIIVTRCEKKDAKQRAKLKAELETQLPFVKQLKRGVLFAGCLNLEDWENGNSDSIRFQFNNITSYRNDLLKLFTTPIDPYELKTSEEKAPFASKPTPSGTQEQHSSFKATVDARLQTPTSSSSYRGDPAVGTTAYYNQPSCKGCDKEVHCRKHCQLELKHGCFLQ